MVYIVCVIGGGMDFKFESDPYGMELHGLMSTAEYTNEIEGLNAALKPARANRTDAIILALHLLPWWAVRRRRHTRRRKQLLHEYIAGFNERNPHLHMRWHRKPASRLTIEHNPVSNRSAERL